MGIYRQHEVVRRAVNAQHHAVSESACWPSTTEYLIARKYKIINIQFHYRIES